MSLSTTSHVIAALASGGPTKSRACSALVKLLTHSETVNETPLWHKNVTTCHSDHSLTRTDKGARGPLICLWFV